MKEKFSLKDTLFNVEKVEMLASEIVTVYPPFSKEAFVKACVDAFPKLELKARISHISEVLFRYLPSRYEEATEIIEKALPEVLDEKKIDDDFGDFIYSPYAAYVECYGCTSEHLIRSLALLREVTKRFSVEFAIRKFINTFPKETLAMLEACALSDNYHERRLASEGLRPRLPWATKLTIDYKVAVPILQRLYADKTRYVTRSVANHLNDISKIDATLVLDLLERWQSSQKQESKEMVYMVSHALRTLVKEGNLAALEMLGYNHFADISISKQRLTPLDVKIGEAVAFSFQVEAKESCALMLDYILHFKTKRGKSSPKVHKIKKIQLSKGESLVIRKEHLFKANMTTRKLYAGRHEIELQINGIRYTLGTFTLHV